MVFRSFRASFAAVVLVLATPADADVFRNSGMHYDLTYSAAWKRTDYPTAVDVALGCTLPICGDDVRFSVASTFNSQLSNATQADFFGMISPDAFVGLVNQMVSPIGTTSVVVAPVRRRIGNVDGYVGQFELTYIDGRVRRLIYGVTFRNGYFYHLQFFCPMKTPQQLFDLAGQTFAGFKLN